MPNTSVAGPNLCPETLARALRPGPHAATAVAATVRRRLTAVADLIPTRSYGQRWPTRDHQAEAIRPGPTGPNATGTNLVEETGYGSEVGHDCTSTSMMIACCSINAKRSADWEQPNLGSELLRQFGSPANSTIRPEGLSSVSILRIHGSANERRVRTPHGAPENKRSAHRELVLPLIEAAFF